MIDDVAVGRWLPGGSPVYAGIAASALGASVEPISNIGRDFPDEYREVLTRAGISFRRVVIAEEPTTRFRLTYSHGERSMKVISLCKPMAVSEILGLVEKGTTLVSPVAGEVSIEAFSAVKRRKLGLLCVDLQGFCRKVTGSKVSSVSPSDIEILRDVDVIKGSREEVEAASRTTEIRVALRKLKEKGAKIAIATLGPRGSLVDDENDVLWSIPAITHPSLRDPTGAGDAFIGAFLAAFDREHDSRASAAFATAASALMMESVGPNVNIVAREVARRAESARQQIRRLA